jgi:hypothetical protein
VHLSNGSDQRAQINGDEDHSVPPPSFLPLSRGGGGPEFHMQLPDDHDRGAQINGACAAPPFSAVRCLTSVGPPPIISSSLPPFPCCRVSSIHPLSWSAWSYLLLTTHSFLATCPAPFHVSLSPKGEFIPSVILLSSRHIFHALIARHHHPRHVPHPPRWPPCLSPQSVCYSMWQHEESSISQSAELAGLFLDPKKQLLRQLVVVRHPLRHNGDVLQ